MNVAVLGASQNPERYSYKAIAMLSEHGHTPYPVHPALKGIQGLTVYATLAQIPQPLDTITLYLSPANSAPLAAEILASGARRVIFNPGAENPPLQDQLAQAGIEVVTACTLVMLRTGQF